MYFTVQTSPSSATFPCIRLCCPAIRQTVNGWKNGLPDDGLSVSMFTVYTAIYGEVQSDFPPNFPFLCKHHPVRQSVFALERNSDRSPLPDTINGQINGLPDCRNGTWVQSFFFFTCSLVCRFAGLPDAVCRSA